jgi:ribosomal protein S18 acetylase RimI-like enzyme
MRLFIVFCLWIAYPLFSDEFFLDKKGESVRIAVARTPADIVTEEGKRILAQSFMTAYEDIPLTELNPSFKSTGDVRRFYQNYFESEFAHFQSGSLIWVQAFIGEKLIGWATFTLEEDDQAYMNLLAVDPLYQNRGIGKHLVFSICSEELFPNTKAINVLLRKVNLQGRLFYEHIGFQDAPDYVSEDNFVDNSLLIPIRWNKYNN